MLDKSAIVATKHAVVVTNNAPMSRQEGRYGQAEFLSDRQQHGRAATYAELKPQIVLRGVDCVEVGHVACARDANRHDLNRRV